MQCQPYDSCEFCRPYQSPSAGVSLTALAAHSVKKRDERKLAVVAREAQHLRCTTATALALLSLRKYGDSSKYECA